LAETQSPGVEFILKESDKVYPCKTYGKHHTAHKIWGKTQMYSITTSKQTQPEVRENAG
jgi:hypothetical protein